MAFMQVLIFCLFLIQNVGVAHSQRSTSSRSTGFCKEFVKSNKFDCSEYMVETSDGFLLALQKITTEGDRKKSKGKNKAPVFLHHGLMQGGETWVLNSLDNSLAFMLADVGYEVWLGNSRTSKFSFGHSQYTERDETYWNWTWDDLLSTDLPAMLKFVHNRSKQSINFVGYSQGTMSLFAALAKGKSLENVIARGVFLAPIGSLSHVSSALIKFTTSTHTDEILLSAGVKEFNAKNDVGQTLLNLICGNAQIDCTQDLMTQITGPNCCVDQSRIANYEKYSLQPTSMKNLVHLSQMVRSGKLSKYDYGLDNMNKYNSLFPPEYDVSKIPATIPMLLIHGGEDMLADPEDVELLVNKLKRKPQVITLSKYAHGDFIMGTSANKDVYIPIIDFFES